VTFPLADGMSAAIASKALHITLDKQVVSDYCPECDEDFNVVRGSAYDEGKPYALYLIALHGHSPAGQLAHLAIALLTRSGDSKYAVAAAMQVACTSDQFQFSLVDWEYSPWQHEEYLGEMLSASEVRCSPHGADFFHIADHIVDEIPEVREYLK
jgi:hypothetical protein